MLFGLDVGRLDQRPARGETFLDDRAELVRRAGRDRDAEDAELLLHVGGAEDLGDCLVEPRHDRRRRAGGSEHRVPRRHLEARHGLADGRDIGHRRVARFLHDGEHADLAAVEVRHRARETEERDLDVAADEIVDGGAAAAIGHVQDVDAGFLAQQLAGKVVRRADAGGAVVDLARIGPGIGDQLGDRMRGKIRMHGEADDVRAGIDDGREILHRVERRILVEVDVAGHHRIGADEQRVAVRRRARRIAGGDVAAHARAIVDDHRLAPGGIEPLGDGARHKVTGGAGRIANHDSDGARGIILRRRRIRDDAKHKNGGRERTQTLEHAMSSRDPALPLNRWRRLGKGSDQTVTIG